MSLSTRLQALVEARKVTHGWVAARFNELTQGSVTSVTVGRWINGAREPSYEDARSLAAVFGVSPGWLVFGEGAATQAAPRADLPDDALETRDQVRAARKRSDPRAG